MIEGAILVIFIIFAISKVLELINWSWWWVTSPLWIPLAIVGLVGIIIAIMQMCGIPTAMIFETHR